jgi:hypothetical protein
MFAGFHGAYSEVFDEMLPFAVFIARDLRGKLTDIGLPSLARFPLFCRPMFPAGGLARIQLPAILAILL